MRFPRPTRPTPSHSYYAPMPSPSVYEMLKKTKSPEEHFATTTARIKQIQVQLESSVRSFKLKDKVCVITGVGSMKGIG
jgi:hypothetical protein